jgi:hypothetical protein
MPYYQVAAQHGTDGTVSCGATAPWTGDTDGLVYLIWREAEIPGRTPLTPEEAASLGRAIALSRGRDPALFLRDVQAWSGGRIPIPGAA